MRKHFKVPLLIIVLILAATPCGLRSQGFRILHEFTGSTDGANPSSGLILLSNTLFGTTHVGGPSGGTLFSLNTNGTGFSVVYGFAGGPTGNPEGTLAMSDNVFYGTGDASGFGNFGSAFSVNTDGTGFQPLYQFSGGDDGGGPEGVILCGNVLYAVTRAGGSFGSGTVCTIDGGLGVTTLYNFSGSDGANPYGALASSGGTLYGVTRNGGGTGNGTVFALNTDGTGFITLHAFMGTANAEGAHPARGMVLAGSVLYGTTFFGGVSGNGTVFRLNLDGSGFKTLYSFGGADGANPLSELTLSGTTLYGTAYGGGSAADGTVFTLSTDGSVFVALHVFNGNDGAGPSAPLVLSANTLYGTTAYGGSSRGGVLFSLSLQAPVAPPVLTITPSGPNVILTWLPDVGPFALQSATNLVAPVAWSEVTQPSSILNGLNTVTNAATGMQRFYRLKQ